MGVLAVEKVSKEVCADEGPICRNLRRQCSLLLEKNGSVELFHPVLFLE